MLVMSIKFHLYFGMALSAMVFMSAMSILFVSCGITDIESFLIAVLAAYIPRLIFCHLVHARCPKCGGEARQQLGALIGKDISYVCNCCGYTQQTEAAYRSDSPHSF
jgi:transposase-like protein